MMDRLFFFALFFVGLLVVSSCSDPTGVGSELPGSGSQGDPAAREIVPDSLASVVSPSFTGQNLPPAALPGESAPPWRFLAGAVQDPIVGTIEAEGYVDFYGQASRDSSIVNASPSQLSAELRLRPTYLHGDTSAAIELALFEIRDEATMDRAPADTTFEVGAQLGAAQTIAPTDSIVTFPLPDAWVQNADHLSAIQSDTTFGDDINGFKLVATQEPSSAQRQVVMGFSHSESALRVTTSEDTVDFDALKSFSHIERRGAPEVTLERRIPLVDGVGASLFMKWDYSTPLFTKQDSALNRADLSVPVDTLKMRESIANEPSFVRPSVNGYRVLATRAEEAPSCGQIGLPPSANGDRTCILPTTPSAAPGVARVTSETAFRIFERALLDTPLFTRFRVEISVQSGPDPSPQTSLQTGLPSTLPVLVRTDGPIETLPRATLILTPL